MVDIRRSERPRMDSNPRGIGDEIREMRDLDSSCIIKIIPIRVINTKIVFVMHV